MWLLKGSPYRVQEVALEQALDRQGFGFFMEMGLGKTAVTLNENARLLKEDKVDGCVVIAPSSLKTNWRNEAEEWGFPERAYVWPDVPKNTDKPFLQIMNYEALAGGACPGYVHLYKLSESKRLVVSLDESTQIKNPESVRTKHLLGLKNNFTYRRVLSGGPITQGPHDMFAQLQYCGALPGKNFYAFRNRFCKMGGFKNRQVVGTRNEEELAQLIQMWGFRAKKEDWTDLPEKIYQQREALLSGKLRNHYEEMHSNFVTWLTDDKAVDAEQVVTKLLKLQQITSGFINDEFGQTHILEAKPPKYHALREIIDEATGKILVFTVFRQTTLALRDLMSDLQPAMLIGGMTDDEIDREKRRFKSDSNCRVFVIQTQTGKYGHTLLGGDTYQDRCSTSVFYENSYSADDRRQAEDRNHRFGQDRGVVYHDLVSSPVDVRAIQTLRRKEDVATAIVDYYRGRA